MYRRRFRPALLLACVLGAAACAAPRPANEGASERASDAGRWETLPPAERPTARHEHGYARVGDRFYLIGGRGAKPVEIFDPAARAWGVGAAPPVEMHHFQAVEYDGKVYVVGAMTGGYPTEPPIPEVHVYDPAANPRNAFSCRSLGLLLPRRGSAPTPVASPARRLARKPVRINIGG